MSEKRGMPFEWAFLMDAIQAERDQGITIDTTQIWFHTAKRPYVIIDAPGHKEFLKNMVTGAASSEAALLLIDAHEGVQEQSRRHGYLLHLLGVKQVAVLVNKMDLVGYSADRFGQVAEEYRAYLRGLGVTPACIIPISAREGDNMVEHCDRDALVPGPDRAAGAGRVRVHGAADRAAAAHAGAGRLQVRPAADHRRPGRERHAPRRRRGGVLAVQQDGGDQDDRGLARAGRARDWRRPGRAIGVTLTEQIFVERGEVMSHVEHAPIESNVFKARLFWLGHKPLQVGNSYTLKLGTLEAPVTVEAIEHVIDTSDLSTKGADKLERNGAGEVVLRTKRMLALDEHVPEPDHRPVRPGRGLPADGRRHHHRWRATPTSAS